MPNQIKRFENILTEKGHSERTLHSAFFWWPKEVC